MSTVKYGASYYRNLVSTITALVQGAFQRPGFRIAATRTFENRLAISAEKDSRGKPLRSGILSQNQWYCEGNLPLPQNLYIVSTEVK